MELSSGTLGALMAAAIVLALAGVALGLVALQGQRRVRGAYAKFSRGRREDVIALLERHIDEVARLREEVRRQRRYADHLRGLLGRTVSRVGLVRYDAFDDMGGRLSFSLALLDEHGDGTVVTAMNGRVQTRTYAKPVKAGTSPHNLSEEEVQAIEQALTAPRRPVPPPPDAAAAPQQTAEPPAPGDAGDAEQAVVVTAPPDGVVDAEALLDRGLTDATQEGR